ncbi:MAG: hydantoinase/oxoprolinase N-terminal domain-containing protein, partial [Myxococcota bacterium]
MGSASVDTGGTFTDLVYRDEDGRRIRLKVPSTPDDPSRAVQDALRALRERAPDITVKELRHGSTVATNALLERRGARTLFITNEGFEDLLRLRRQDRPELYALHPQVSPPLVAAVAGLPGRLGADGREHQALPDLARWIDIHTPGDFESVALCLLHSYLSPDHEAALAKAFRERFPDVPLTVSSELAPLHREYERASTTVVNAYVAPLMARYLMTLEQGLDSAPL